MRSPSARCDLFTKCSVHAVSYDPDHVSEKRFNLLRSPPSCHSIGHTGFPQETVDLQRSPGRQAYLLPECLKNPMSQRPSTLRPDSVWPESACAYTYSH